MLMVKIGIALTVPYIFLYYLACCFYFAQLLLLLDFVCLQRSVYGMKLPTGFQLIGEVGLKDYESWMSYFSDQAKMESRDPITKRAHAR